MALKRWSICHFLRVHSFEVGIILFFTSLWVVYVVEGNWYTHKRPTDTQSLSGGRYAKELSPRSPYEAVPEEARQNVKAYIQAKFNHSCYKANPSDLSSRVLLEKDELEKRGCKQKLPQAITIGGRKCGTSNILQFLRFHPAIEMRTSLVPLDFFSGAYTSGLGLYRKQMPYTTEKQMTIEKTPEFFVVPYDVPKKVHDDIGSNTKILAVVCDPVKRIISDYVNLAKRDKNPEEIDQYLSKSLENTIMSEAGQINHLNALVDGSMYFKHFMRWLHLFPLEQIFLIDADTIAKHPSRELQRMETFLGIPPYFDDTHFRFDDEHSKYCLRFPQDLCVESKKRKQKNRKKDQAAFYTKKDVPETLKSQLYEYFEPYDQMLAEKFNQSLSWRNSK
ncbi:heparan sulfate glucosamine 3-O-sulfotransferase 1-like [Ptychodera flava]|uniref:heparan sulfate glucosamine 3-O-sulfotransferase 1-like n=1 Tax=Ptychodera flava TaxID=63121 RepID=UPI00396A08ED